MLNLVDNILNFAKYEHTDLTLNLSEVNLFEIINAAYKNTDFLFSQKGKIFNYKFKNLLML
jgi:signal transduction histidine kinase